MPLDTSQHRIPRLKGDERLANLGEAARIWVIGSIYGRYGQLCQVHEHLTNHVRAGDRIVYLGNYLGSHSLWTGQGISLINELVEFRNLLIAVPGFFANDIHFLHGQGEDLLQQVLHLPFQKNHAAWLQKASLYGLENYTTPYGGTGDEINHIGHLGIIAMNKWSHHIRQMIARFPGHAEFFAHLKSAAITQSKNAAQSLLFVPAGLSPHHPLSLQHDLLCWPEQDIAQLTHYAPFVRIIRGQSFTNSPIDKTKFVLTLDDGAGMNGTLHAACLDPQGRIMEWLNF